jgi:hypothetical protein
MNTLDFDGKKLDGDLGSRQFNNINVAEANLILVYSQAVSLKRIADNLDKIASGELVNAMFMQPINQYGESFTDAIQNGIERGQRGINTNDR